jgi:hypothetical protein
MDKIKAKLKSIAGIGEEGEKKKKIDDTLSSCQYAILPDDKVLVGWTPENKEELDDRVRHMLHSRRAKMKRAMKGFRQYVRRREFPHRSFFDLALINGLSQPLDYS